MNEKLKKLKELLASDEVEGYVTGLRKEDLAELIAIVEAVTAPNMRLAMDRFQTHVESLNAQLRRQVESINRLLAIAEEARKAARG